MFPGSPAPLPPGTRLTDLPPFPRCPDIVGVWLRGCRGLRLLRLRNSPGLLLGRDLGTLLRRCEAVAVRVAGRPRVLSASQLVRFRVLEVVLGTPFLPPPAQLRELYPGVARQAHSYSIPLGLGSAEEALALCAAEGVAVRGSRIRYHSVSS